MRLLIRFLFIALLSCLFISCQDKVINNNYDDVYVYDLGVNIDTCFFESITAHKDCFDPDLSANAHTGYESFTGINLIVKLDDPSRKDDVERLVMASGNQGCGFNKQELEEAYNDSVGGYIFDNVFTGTYYSRPWQFTLYGASNKASSAYEQMLPLGYAIYPQNCVNNWINSGLLEVSFYDSIEDTSSNILIETHFLNSGKEELSTVYSTPETFTWRINNVPDEAVYFYFIIKDEFRGTKRTYYSNINLISDRIPENTFVYPKVESPQAIFYLDEINKVLVYSYSQLSLIDAFTGEIIWQKENYTEPTSAAYWKDKKRILCSFGEYSSSVDLINPLDGEVEDFLDFFSNVSSILFTPNYLVLNIGKVVLYDISAEQLINKNYFIYSSNGIAYNSINKSLYARTNQSILSVSLDKTDDGPSLKRLSEIAAQKQYESFEYFNVSPDYSRLYEGEGHIYRCSSDSGLTLEADIEPFLSGTFTPGGYFAALTPAYTFNGEEHQPAVRIYDNANKLAGTISGLIGDPKLITNNGDYLYIYTSWNSKLAVQKISISQSLQPAGKKNSGAKKIYYSVKS